MASPIYEDTGEADKMSATWSELSDRGVSFKQFCKVMDFDEYSLSYAIREGREIGPFEFTTEQARAFGLFDQD